MAQYKVPVFERGSILSQDMLVRLKEYAIDLWSLQIKGYADGILQGCEITVLEHMIQIHTGILVYQGELLFLNKEMKVPYFPENKWQILKMQFGVKRQEKSFLMQEMDIVVTGEQEVRDNEIELARFRLQGGATLRSDYRNFQDLSTEYDTLNLIHTKWAAFGESSVSYEILRLFAEEAIKKNLQSPEDFCMVEQILTANGRTLNRTAIELYIAKRLGRPMRQMTNEEIYKGLCEILKVVQTGGGSTMSRMRENRRMIVD